MEIVLLVIVFITAIMLADAARTTYHLFELRTESKRAERLLNEKEN